jgi:hypothetical protein
LPLLCAVVTGWALVRLDPDITHSVEVERVDSSQAQIESVHVRDHAGDLAISGRLHKRYQGRSPVPRRLYVEEMDKDGALLGRAAIPYRPLSAKTGTSEFSEIPAIDTALVAVVRVTHHTAAADDPPI